MTTNDLCQLSRNVSSLPYLFHLKVSTQVYQALPRLCRVSLSVVVLASRQEETLKMLPSDHIAVTTKTNSRAKRWSFE